MHLDDDDEEGYVDFNLFSTRSSDPRLADLIGSPSAGMASAACCISIPIYDGAGIRSAFVPIQYSLIATTVYVPYFFMDLPKPCLIATTGEALQCCFHSGILADGRLCHTRSATAYPKAQSLVVNPVMVSSIR